MNIFEFLGLPKDHRAENKVTQFVKHFDEVVEKHKTGKTFLGQVKKDGVCSLVVVHKGNIRIFSRTGKEFTNTANLVSRLYYLDIADGVYMGEMWMPKSIMSLEELSGAVNPNRVRPLNSKLANISFNLNMSFFDGVSLEEFIEGSSPRNFMARHRMQLGPVKTSEAGIEVLGYHLLETPSQIEHYAEEAIRMGEEGIVIRDPNADWVAGHKGYRVMKKVRGVDYDLRCIGWEEGKGKYKNRVANLLFSWKGGKTIKAMLGKGWSHQMAGEMYEAIMESSRANRHMQGSPIGHIFQVYALEESSKGKLRLVKVGEKRHDKTVADV